MTPPPGVSGFGEPGEGRHEGFGTRAYQQALRKIFLPSGFEAYAFGAASSDHGMLRHGLRSGVPYRGSDSGHQLPDHLFLALEEFGIVVAGFGDMHAVALSVLGEVVQLRAVEKGLGGDAAFVEAHSSERLLLEQHGRQAGGSGSFGGDVSRGTASEYRQIEHFLILFCGCPSYGFFPDRRMPSTVFRTAAAGCPPTCAQAAPGWRCFRSRRPPVFPRLRFPRPGRR